MKRFGWFIYSLMIGLLLVPLAACGTTHEHDYQAYQTIEATCQKEGGTIYRCSCGEEYFKAETDKLPHMFVQATSVDDSSHRAVCTVCGEEAISAHTFSDWSSKDGGHVRTCTVCGYAQESQHNYGDWTAEADGHQRVCRVCGAIDVQAHAFGDWVDVDATTHKHMCTVCYATETTTHTFGDWTFADSLRHVHTCTLCQNEQKENHAWTGWESADAETHTRSCPDCSEKETQAHTFSQWTANTDGTHTRSCLVCGYVETQSHTAGQWSSSDDTSHRSNCTVCGGSISEAHTFGKYTADGDTHTATCLTCGYVVTEAHRNDDWTDLGDGTHRCVCADCGSVRIEAHDYGDWVDLGDGTHEQSCKGCHATETAKHTLTGATSYNATQHVKTCVCGYSQAENHTFGGWTNIDSTTHGRTCSVCHEQITESHRWNAGTVIEQATHEQTGKKTYTCTICGGQKTETTPEVPHDFSVRSTASRYLCRQATDTTSATYYYSCSCGAHGNYVFTEGDSKGYSIELIKGTRSATVHGEYTPEISSETISIAFDGILTAQDGLNARFDVSFSYGEFGGEASLCYKNDVIYLSCGGLNIKVPKSDINHVKDVICDTINGVSEIFGDGSNVSFDDIVIDDVIDSFLRDFALTEQKGKAVATFSAFDQCIAYNPTANTLSASWQNGYWTMTYGNDTIEWPSVTYLDETSLDEVSRDILDVCRITERDDCHLDLSATLTDSDQTQYTLTGTIDVVRATADRPLSCTANLKLINADPSARSFYFSLTYKDEWLYLTCGNCEPSSDRYNPAKIKLSPSDLLGIVDTAEGAFNVDLSVLHSVFEAIGLTPSAQEMLTRTAEEALPVLLAEQSPVTHHLSQAIKAVEVDGNHVLIKLDLSELYDSPVKETQVRFDRDGESLKFTLDGVTVADTQTQELVNASVTVGQTVTTPAVPADAASYLDLTTFDEMIQMLADSLTETVDDKTTWQERYYLSGKLELQYAGSGTTAATFAPSLAINYNTQTGVATGVIESEASRFINNGATHTYFIVDTNEGIVTFVRHRLSYYAKASDRMSGKTTACDTYDFRSMTFGELGDTLGEQINFVLNTYGTIHDTIADNVTGGHSDTTQPSEETSTKKAFDLGAYIAKYAFDPVAGTYTVVANGAVLSDSLNDITLTLTQNEQGKLIAINLSLVASGFTVSLKDMAYQNVTGTDETSLTASGIKEVYLLLSSDPDGSFRNFTIDYDSPFVPLSGITDSVKTPDAVLKREN